MLHIWIRFYHCGGLHKWCNPFFGMLSLTLISQRQFQEAESKDAQKQEQGEVIQKNIFLCCSLVRQAVSSVGGIQEM